MTYLFFIMVMTQSAAYLWFQSKGGVVSHRNYIIVNACFMVGQSAQAIESYSNGALASFFVASFFFVMTAIGIFNRYKLSKKQ
jgi:hypothetical protein